MLRTVSSETDPPPNKFAASFYTNMSITSLDRFFWEDLLDPDKLPKEAKP